MKKSAIYIRVSTNYQIDKDSLPLQREDLINYSKYALNIEDYVIFEDAGYSGKNTDRPSYQDMITRLKNKEFTHLLVWKIDRISRNLIDFCSMYDEIKEYGVTFISKNEQFDTSSAMGEAMLKIILVFAELERKLTAERVTAVMLDRASKGLWNGAPMPLGYKWDNIIKFPTIDDTESKIIKLIYEEYLKCQSSFHVRNLLNMNSIKTKRSGTWTTKTISDIIRNPFYKGTYRYNYREAARGKKKNENEWILLDNNHPAIIEKELWEKCNDVMNINANRNNAKFRSNSKTHVFASLLTCGECTKGLHAKQDKPHLDGYIPSIYVCSGRYNNLGCNQKTVSDNIVGTFVLKYIANITNLTLNIKFDDIERTLLTGKVFSNVIGIDNESLSKIYKIIHSNDEILFTSKVNVETKDNTFEMESLQKEKEKFNRALTRLDDLYLFEDEAMSEKDYILKKNNLKNMIDEINNKLKDFNNVTVKSDSDFIIQVKALALTLELKNNDDINYKSIVQSIGRDTLKELMNSIINKIIVKNRKITSIEFKNGLISTFVNAD